MQCALLNEPKNSSSFFFVTLNDIWKVSLKRSASVAFLSPQNMCILWYRHLSRRNSKIKDTTEKLKKMWLLGRFISFSESSCLTLTVVREWGVIRVFDLIQRKSLASIQYLLILKKILIVFVSSRNQAQHIEADCFSLPHKSTWIYYRTGMVVLTSLKSKFQSFFSVCPGWYSRGHHWDVPVSWPYQVFCRVAILAGHVDYFQSSSVEWKYLDLLGWSLTPFAVSSFTFNFSQLNIWTLISFKRASRMAIRVIARQASLARYLNGSTSSNLNW